MAGWVEWLESTSITAPLAGNRMAGWGEWLESKSITAPLAGAVLVTLLVLAVGSFVGQQIVHPLTGLGIIGGCLGALLAFPGMFRLVFEENGGEGFVISASLDVLREDSTLSLLAVTYGAVLGFVFPTLFRVGGGILTSSDWIFGSIRHLEPSILTTATFVILLIVTTWVFAELVLKRNIDGNGAVHLVTGYLVYGVPLVIATGFASSVWYDLMLGM